MKIVRAAQDIIFSGEAYRNFIYSVKSEATKKSYTKALRLFMRYRTTTTCEQLLQGEARLIQINIIDWLIHLKENQKLSSASITAYCAALNHFYSMNDVTSLNWKKINSFIGESTKAVKDRPYTRDEIRILLDAANDKRLKIAILLMCSSGVRIGAISSLKIRSLKAITKYRIYQITVYENTKEEYITFCTPECAAAIDSYLEYRRRNGDRLLPNEPLIREEFDIDDPIRAANPRAIAKDRSLQDIQQKIEETGNKLKGATDKEDPTKMQLYSDKLSNYKSIREEIDHLTLYPFDWNILKIVIPNILSLVTLIAKASIFNISLTFEDAINALKDVFK